MHSSGRGVSRAFQAFLPHCVPFNQFTRNRLSRSPTLTQALVEVDNPPHTHTTTSLSSPSFPSLPLATFLWEPQKWWSGARIKQAGKCDNTRNHTNISHLREREREETSVQARLRRSNTCFADHPLGHLGQSCLWTWVPPAGQSLFRQVEALHVL